MNATLIFIVILGILGIIWYVFWLLLVFDSPAKHPRISKSEKEYIEFGISGASVGLEEKVCANFYSVNSTNNTTPFSTCCLYMFFPHSGPCSLVPNPYITGSMGYHNSSCQHQLGQLHNAHLHTLLLPRCTWSVIRTCMRAIERV